MIEILHTFGFWDNKSSTSTPFTSAHVCEGPGGFLQHTVEGLKERRVSIRNLFAMTLRPTKSHIPGWRRSIHFLRKYPEISLQYGADDTGDILLPANQQKFVQIAQGAQLFTADGGFDFSINYTQQELQAFPLILASFVIGLQVLAKDGFLVIKLFDMYSTAMQDLILGSALLFEKFCIYKPATSRPCNSERYFVGIGYKGPNPAWIQHLKQAQQAHTLSPLTHLVKPNSWPAPVLDLLKEQILWQEQQQIKMIDETLHFEKSTIQQKLLVNLRASKQWCEAFHVPYSLPVSANLGLT
jgi:23S rRNA U2552 (ribose-2'-O)-methylase RlmE/FtsJ